MSILNRILIEESNVIYACLNAIKSKHGNLNNIALQAKDMSTDIIFEGRELMARVKVVVDKGRCNVSLNTSHQFIIDGVQALEVL